MEVADLKPLTPPPPSSSSDSSAATATSDFSAVTAADDHPLLNPEPRPPPPPSSDDHRLLKPEPLPPQPPTYAADYSADDRPLLKAEPLPSQLSIDEMKRKYAAYVRRDVYGTMGRGEVPWTEKVLLGLSLVTLVPIRIVAAMTLLVVYYLVCRVCTASKEANRGEGEEDEQEDYAHLGGWRRGVIVATGRFLSRVMLFVLGFYWISEMQCEVTIQELICLVKIK